jgi:hypothetical protein
MTDIKCDCPGENVLRHGLIFICHDARKGACENVNIISDKNHIEIYICQDPHPLEDKKR